MKGGEYMKRYFVEGSIKIPFNIVVTGNDDEEVWENIVERLDSLYDCETSEYTVDFITSE